MHASYMSIKESGCEVLFKEGDEQNARKTMEFLKNSVNFLSQYFGITPPGNLRLFLVQDRGEFDRLVVDLLGVDIEIPSNPGRLAQPQKKDMVFISPAAYGEHSTYEFNPEEFERLVFHETTHVFEEYLSPNIELMPRWWSEGLAVYVSGHWQFRDQFKFRKAVEKNLPEGKIPDFEEINRSIDLSYDWGWTLVMFIEKTLGKEAIRKAVMECGDGNIPETLGWKKDDFEREWKEWLLGEGKELIGIQRGKGDCFEKRIRRRR